MDVFKAYDVRGIYGTELTDELAYCVGRALVVYLKAKSIAVGHDMRSHSGPLYKNLIQGMMDEGAVVHKIGLCETPALYFAVHHLKTDGGAMITASHNPPEYNGIKLTRKQALPIGQGNGMEEIKALATSLKNKPKKKGGRQKDVDIWKAYVKHVTSFLSKPRPLNIVIDAANGMSGFTVPKVFRQLPFNVTPLYFELDGTFPNHEANPLKEENTRDLQKLVKKQKADLGIAFDGDCDRAFFITEKGERIPADFLEAFVADYLLKKHPKSTVLYDVRSTWVVKETVERAGGKAFMSKVGHAFIKKQMRETNAVFAGELAGHFYFRNNFFTDSGIIAAMHVLQILCESAKPFSQLIKPYLRYCQSGEINFTVKNADRVLAQIPKLYNDGTLCDIDGIRVDYQDYWFSVRKSNTEPLIRLTAEAKTASLLNHKVKELSKLVKKYGK